MLLYILVILACAGLNRAAGDDRWMPSVLPGRALYYVAPVIAALALLLYPWPVAVAFGLAFFVWRAPGWGRWYDLGNLSDEVTGRDQDSNVPESLIETISFGNLYLAMFWRHLLIAPGLALVCWLLGDFSGLWLAIPFALMVVAVYDLSWRLWPAHPVLLAEILVGALWGDLIVSLSL